ncbi:hypothetical protein E2C01_040728 [Portunus trituberculatus]|uniref:Uncharacterized protein n=1 Tax=Portunus trituberculatus TaxID=210409 RepID=A0A5B7FRJ3_PORTR|nr:hypothetical protein [Portunus trituberculatus]
MEPLESSDGEKKVNTSQTTSQETNHTSHHFSLAASTSLSPSHVYYCWTSTCLLGLTAEK